MNKIIPLLFLLAFTAHAETVITSVSVRFNNDNLWTSTQPAPEKLLSDLGNLQIWGMSDGSILTYTRYMNEQGIRIDAFTLEDAKWWMTNKGMIYGVNSIGLEPMASTSLQALSIYLTL